MSERADMTMAEDKGNNRYHVESGAPPSFSLATLLIAVAVVCVCLSIALRLGVVLGSFAVCLVAVYYVARWMNRKFLVVCCAVVAFVAALPWFGIRRGAFVIPFGSRKYLPTVVAPQEVRETLHPVYDISTVPLEVATLFGQQFREVTFFARSGVIMPFIVFVFWLGIELALLTALLVGMGKVIYRRRTRWDDSRDLRRL